MHHQACTIKWTWWCMLDTKPCLPGQCISGVNQATKTYIGMTEGEFKTRFYYHKQSFNNKKYASSTALSKYIWELKEAET